MLPPLFVLLLLGLLQQPSPTQEPVEEPTADDSLVEQQEQTPEEEAEVVLRWPERIEQLAQRIEAGETDRREADEIFPELSEVLEEHLDELRIVLRSARSVIDPVQRMGPIPPEEQEQQDAPPVQTVEDLYEHSRALYRARNRLIWVCTPDLRRELLGSGIAGVRELWTELEAVAIHARYQRLAVPRGFRQMMRELRAAPLPTIRSFLWIAVAIVVFRYWRRWAGEGLARARSRLATSARRTRNVTALRIARSLWYIDRIRRPAEWFLLFSVVFALVDMSALPEPRWIVRTALNWFLIASFAVALVDGYTARTLTNDSPERTKLRLRSLRLIAGWLVFLGLGLALAKQLAMRGTMRAWVLMTFEALALPLAFILIAMWRKEVFKRLEEESADSAFAARLAQTQRGLKSFANCAAGIAYLTWLFLQRRAMRMLAQFEGGRRVLAESRRREVTRQVEQLTGDREINPISDELREKLLKGAAEVGVKYGEDQASELSALIERGGIAIYVIGERGCGLSAFLRGVVERYEGRALLLKCRDSDPDLVWGQLLEQLDLSPDASSEQIAERIRERDLMFIGVDNVHRLTRPAIGGQAGLDEISERVRAVGPATCWVCSMNSSAYHYISRSRENALGAPVKLPAWTDEQIGQLVELRCEEAGIELDFEQLHMGRQLDDIGFRTLEERNRHGFYRVLWVASDGNPTVALHLLADSLVPIHDGKTFVPLLREPSLKEIESLSFPALLLLRYLVQTERAPLDEIIDSLQLPRGLGVASLLTCVQKGFVEEHSGSFGISWKWFRHITRVLVRRNLLPPTRPSTSKSNVNQPEGVT